MLAGLSLAASQAALAQTLYGATSTRNGISDAGVLVILNPSTGAVLSTVGSLLDASSQHYSLTGLAFDPITGILYGSTANNSPTAARSLVTVNPLTAQVTLIGPVGGGGTLSDISFNSAGQLFGWSEPSSNDLVSVNLATGAATVVGPSGLNTAGSGLAFNASDTLYFTGTGDGGFLHTIDPSTGAPTTVAALSGGIFGGNINALTFDASGTLFGSDNSLGGFGGTHLISINTTTGVITDRGPSINRLDALAFAPSTPAPEPASAALLLTGALPLLAMAVRKRRQR